MLSMVSSVCSTSPTSTSENVSEHWTRMCTMHIAFSFPLGSEILVVQYQQTMVIAHILDEQGYLVVYLPWQIEMLLIRDKADTLPQE